MIFLTVFSISRIGFNSFIKNRAVCRPMLAGSLTPGMQARPLPQVQLVRARSMHSLQPKPAPDVGAYGKRVLQAAVNSYPSRMDFARHFPQAVNRPDYRSWLQQDLDPQRLMEKRFSGLKFQKKKAPVITEEQYRNLIFHPETGHIKVLSRDDQVLSLEEQYRRMEQDGAYDVMVEVMDSCGDRAFLSNPDNIFAYARANLKSHYVSPQKVIWVMEKMIAQDIDVSEAYHMIGHAHAFLSRTAKGIYTLKELDSEPFELYRQCFPAEELKKCYSFYETHSDKAIHYLNKAYEMSNLPEHGAALLVQYLERNDVASAKETASKIHTSFADPRCDPMSYLISCALLDQRGIEFEYMLCQLSRTSDAEQQFRYLQPYCQGSVALQKILSAFKG